MVLHKNMLHKFGSVQDFIDFFAGNSAQSKKIFIFKRHFITFSSNLEVGIRSVPSIEPSPIFDHLSAITTLFIPSISLR